MASFHLQVSLPTGDQPQAIAQLVNKSEGNHRYQTLLGATGTGKTFCSSDREIANSTLFSRITKPQPRSCVMNYRIFPGNAVEYFIGVNTILPTESLAFLRHRYIYRENRPQSMMRFIMLRHWQRDRCLNAVM